MSESTNLRTPICATAVVNAQGQIETRSADIDGAHTSLVDLVSAEDHALVDGLITAGGGACNVRPTLAGWPATASLCLEALMDNDGTNKWLVRLQARAERLALEEMVSVVAHEIKNPLAGICGALEVVGARAVRGSDEARMMFAARERVRSLDETLEDLLLLTRPLTVERVATDLHLLVQQSILRAANNLDCLPPTLHCDAPPKNIPLDGILMNRAVGYLLDHALKEDAQTSEVHLEAALGGATLRISYENGQLERDISNRIFDPRYLSRSRRTGLHLPVAARLITAHGGDICTDVARDKVRLTVYLPAPTAPRVDG